MKPHLIVLGLSLAASFATAQAEPGPWQTLFDGTSLAGWEYEEDWWRVEDGAIVGEIPAGTTLDHNTWLVWAGGELADFELRLQFQIEGAPAANSGIQFRCQVESPRHVSGYQADLDMGATWLGRIYDEHGRALLVERGTRVWIHPDGKRQVERFAPADTYAVLFREKTWNDYRIRAAGEQISVEINGTLFSELIDQQMEEKDLVGQLAMQLHSGPETRVRFRDIRLRALDAADLTLTFQETKESVSDPGIVPTDGEGRDLNLGFENGTLEDWTADGTAFSDQPVNEDGIASRWPGQTSQKEGQYFIGGYEIHRNDSPQGTLTSVPFDVTHPYASYLFAGGDRSKVRAEILLAPSGEVIHAGGGEDREEMRRVAVDLRPYQGKRIQVRLVDASSGAWGHLNFDDFRFHQEPPQDLGDNGPRRLTDSPILTHLVPNPLGEDTEGLAKETLGSMWLEPGFTAELIASEPDVRQPIAFAFDDRGRLWIAEALSYPEKRPPGEGQDRLVILEDTEGDGSWKTRRVFAEQLNLVSGFEVGHGGVWVGAAPELLFIPDADGDDVPDDKPQVLLDGFGLQDTHETLNSFLWGPDGWLYGNQGVFNESWIGKPGSPRAEREHLFAGVWRYHPVRHEFEVFAWGGSNQWGLDYDDMGEMFMTHCRSHFGKGATSHVVQGGHYWNQTNRNYASFISSDAPRGYPELRNYLLASAPYGHGEGGAGKRGSRRVFGGHSHVGTMFYLGDNWPASYRNHLYTHNLHGHQINRQFNRARGSGFETLHAGRDLFYSTDPRYIAVDLQTGPDGAVYVIDWTDQQHCHNPNTEQWHRDSGRVYRIAYADTYAPVSVHLSQESDLDLAKLIVHKNDWYVRTARRLLQERASQETAGAKAQGFLSSALEEHPEARIRLRALWALQAMDALDDKLGLIALADPSAAVRAWSIQLLCDRDRPLSDSVVQAIAGLATDASPLAQRYLASALPRLPDSAARTVTENLSGQASLGEDPNIPHLLWSHLARVLPDSLDWAFHLAEDTAIPSLQAQIYWYASRLQGEALNRVMEKLTDAEVDNGFLLEMISHGLRGQRGLAMPPAWEGMAPALYEDKEERRRRLAEEIGAGFGDQRLLPRLRRRLTDTHASPEQRRHAFDLLAKAGDTDSLPDFLNLFDEPSYRLDVLNLLARFEDPRIPEAIIERFGSLDQAEQAAALVTLTSRVSNGRRLLEAIETDSIPRAKLTAFHARQLGNLEDDRLQAELAKVWGKIAQSPQELLREIDALEKTYNEAPLWAYSSGQAHFQALCSACHQVKDEGGLIGPDLTGSGANGVRYFLENIITPNAVVGSDYQLSIIQTNDEQTIAGMIVEDTASALTIQTLTETVTVEKSAIASISVSDQSLMPPGLLGELNERQVIELLKYLTNL